MIGLLCLVVAFGWSIAETHQRQVKKNYLDRSTYDQTARNLPHLLAVIQKDLYKLSIWSTLRVEGDEITSTRTAIDTRIDEVRAMTAKLAARHPIVTLADTIDRYIAAVEETLILIERSPEIGATAIRGSENIYLEAKSVVEIMTEAMGTLFDRRLQATHESSRRMILQVLVMIGAVGLLTLALALGSSRYIALPIRNLAEVVDRFRKGDLDVEIFWTRRRDEIGLVARAMEAFRESLIRNQTLERERKQLNHELERKVDERTRQLGEQKERLAQALEKEHELNGLQRQFVAMVCHEFRTPLAIIDGNAQRILKRREQMSADRFETTMSKIRTAVVRLTTLMESVLSASRLEAGTIDMKRAPCNVGQMIEEIVGNFSDVHPNHRISADIQDLPADFMVDEQLIRQAISNLVSNAVKYSPDGAQVRINARLEDDGGMIIAVQDQGVGIPAAELEKLFQRFFRASTSVGIAGTGIGLHLVKTLVDMHGGRIDVHSEVGSGTTFRVFLPREETCPSPDQHTSGDRTHVDEAA